jgi:hypothetical protein
MTLDEENQGLLQKSGKKSTSNNTLNTLIPSNDQKQNIEKKLSISNYGSMTDQTALSYFELYISFFEIIRFKGFIEER